MVRPQTKGAPIQFRLPIDLHEIVVELAGAQTPTEYVYGLLVDRLTEIQRQRAARINGEAQP